MPAFPQLLRVELSLFLELSMRLESDSKINSSSLAAIAIFWINQWNHRSKPIRADKFSSTPSSYALASASSSNRWISFGSCFSFKTPWMSLFSSPFRWLFSQLLLGQCFSDHSYHQQRHLHDPIPVSDVTPSGELTNVAVEILGTHPMVGAVIASLHHWPKWLHSVDVRHFIDILADAMPDHFVIVSLNIRVTLEVIRIDVWT